MRAHSPSARRCATPVVIATLMGTLAGCVVPDGTAPTSEVSRALHDAGMVRVMPGGRDADVRRLAPAVTRPSVGSNAPSPVPANPATGLFGADGFRVVRVRGTALDEHAVLFDRLDRVGYGYGVGLADVDGDGDDDLFVGTTVAGGADACLYENASTPGSIAFRRRDVLCGPSLSDARAGQGVDLDGDGVDELIVLGVNRVELVRFVPELTTTDLLAAYEPANPRPECIASAALPLDVNRDGLLDLIVACSTVRATSRPADDNLVLRQTTAGELVPMTESAWAALADPGVTLALAAHDLNNDGLLDVTVANDSFSTIGRRNIHLAPGRFTFASPPDTSRLYESIRVVANDTAWGSFMGVGVLHSAYHGSLVYLSDWGPNRALQSDRTDVAVSLGISIGTPLTEPLFSWGVIVDDLDRNGTDDLIVTQGSIGVGLHSVDHSHFVLFQTPSGSFVSAGHAVGFESESYGADGITPDDHLARAGARTDLDRDGDMEIVIVGASGAPRVYSELAREDVPPRCTITPHSRYVPTWGHGIGVRGRGDGHFRYAEVQGQLHLGRPDELLSARNAGVIRFASGAVIPFDCEESPGPVDVVEPAWLEIVRTGDGLSLSLDASVREESGDAAVSAALRSEEGIVRIVELGTLRDGRFEIDAGAATEVMVRVEERWIPRWLSAR